MIRLYVVAEGQTEETFVRDLLAHHLASSDVVATVFCVRTKVTPQHTHRGGIGTYEQLKRDVVKTLRNNHGNDVRVTTMIDLYALPNTFPDYDAARRVPDCYQRVYALEAAFGQDIGDWRFLPHLQLHEFEALLFTDPSQFGAYFIDQHEAISELEAVRRTFDTPERIDDTPEGAPSKRILSAFDSYPKATAGPQIAEAIGLDAMRAVCPHFDEWVTKLEQLGSR